jgi:apolipoprotein N-acyltransferase
LRPWLLLVPALVLLPFANGATTVFLAAWLSPLFVLRFVREQRAWVGLPVAYVLLAAAFSFQFRGMVPIPGIGYFIFLAAYGVVLILPYVADRLVSPRLEGLQATFVFPAAWAAMDYLNSLGPYGSWGSPAYSQYGNLPVLQILSVTGLWGVTFLIGWFAAVGVWLWRERASSRGALRGAAVFAGVLVIVVLLGGARMALFPPSSETVRIASVSQSKTQSEADNSAWVNMLQNRATEAEVEQVRAWTNAVNNGLLERAEREARAGAKIVFWAEANALVFKEEEAALIERGRALAAKHRIYLGMALASWRRTAAPPLENKLVVIEPTGEVAWEFFKARPVPGGEASISVTTDGRLPSLDTPYGRLTSVICFDADFPQLLAQAGAMDADLVLDPSNDWQAIDPWHTQMASFRAIEQGFSLVRHTSGGLSAAYDHQGRRLAATDEYQAAENVLVAQVPTKGVRTIYSRLGDWFAWFCLAGVAWSAFRAATAGRRRKISRPAAI